MKTKAVGGLLAIGIAIALGIQLPANFERGHVDQPAPAFAGRAPAMGAFSLNVGQVANSEIRYYATAHTIAIGFTVGGVNLVLTEPYLTSVDRHSLDVPPASEGGRPRGVALRLTFIGTNPVEPEGRDPLPYQSHYLLGNDSAKWRTDVRNFREIFYSELWPGIDLRYLLTKQGPKYEYLVHEGARPEDIRVAYDGVDGLAVDAAGDLVASTPVGQVRDTAPQAFRGGRNVECGFYLRKPLTVGVACSPSDDRGTLTIDPVLSATFLGGSDSDRPQSIAVDDWGNAYITGETLSPDFPTTPGVFDATPNAGMDVFVSKMSPDLSSLIYATYLGGDALDSGTSIAVDDAGRVYVTGFSNSPNFPVTPGAFDATYNGGGDAFVAKLSSNGSSLVFSTFLGGNETDFGQSLALDNAGGVYVTGYANANFPTTPGALDTSYNGFGDVFVAHLDSTGGFLISATLLGGTGSEGAWGGSSIVLDSVGEVFVTGNTNSRDFPTTPGAFDRIRHGPGEVLDAFVAKLSPDLTSLIYSTYLGGADTDSGESIAVDANGSAYVAISTHSADFPTTPGAFDRQFNGSFSLYDGAVVKLDPAGSTLMYSTFLGGSGSDIPYGLALDSGGNASVTGTTGSADFPTTPDALDRTLDGRQDAFLATLDKTGSSLLYGTFLGGTGTEIATSIARDFGGSLYLTGLTTSSDFPATIGAFDTTYGGSLDGFVVAIRLPSDLAITSNDLVLMPSNPRNGLPEDLAVNVTNVGEGAVAQFSTTAFDDRNGNGQIDPGEPFATLASGPLQPGKALTLHFPWTPNATGMHRVCAWADPLNLIMEINEGNNSACLDVSVASGPELRPDYVPWQPLPSTAVVVGLSLPVSFSLAVRNVGNGSATSAAILAFLNESMPPFATFPVPPIASNAVSGRFTASWTAPAIPGTYRVIADVDYGGDIAEWNETNNTHAWTITVTSGPITSLVIGQPNVAGSVVFVTPRTPISFAVLDRSGTGIRQTMYRIGGGPWSNYSDLGPFTLIGEGDHLLEWFTEDNAGNIESTQSTTLEVDGLPPATSIAVGDPKYVAVDTFVTSSTLLSLTSTDGGITPVGVDFVEYRIAAGPWTTYAFPFVLSLGDGPQTIEYRSRDLLGNAEAAQSLQVVVDNTPPTTTPSLGAGTFPANTQFSLEATDAASGVSRTELRVDDGGWAVYTGPFTLVSGPHSIRYRSVDHLGNLEAEERFDVWVQETAPPPATNLKPLVALVFVLLLIAAGAWSSRRAPLGTGSVRRRAALAFVAFALPFVVLETTTGIVSLLTGLLSIPPLLGLGTSVDLVILWTGLAVSWYRSLSVRPARSAKTSPGRDL